MEHPIDKDEPWAVLAASRHDAAAAATRSPLSSRAGEQRSARAAEKRALLGAVGTSGH